MSPSPPFLPPSPPPPLFLADTDTGRGLVYSLLGSSLAPGKLDSSSRKAPNSRSLSSRARPASPRRSVRECIELPEGGNHCGFQISTSPSRNRPLSNYLYCRRNHRRLGCTPSGSSSFTVTPCVPYNVGEKYVEVQRGR